MKFNAKYIISSSIFLDISFCIKLAAIQEALENSKSHTNLKIVFACYAVNRKIGKKNLPLHCKKLKINFTCLKNNVYQYC